MKDEFLGKYFSEDPDKNPIDSETTAGDLDQELIDQAQSVIERIDMLKQMEAINTNRALNNLSMKMLGRQKRSDLRFFWQKVAAILVLPLITVTLWQGVLLQNAKNDDFMIVNEIATPPTLRSTFELPDGTKVWLNGSSTIKYPTRFSGKERMVELDGEAYFEVFSNPEQPFLVKTGEILVEAVGTTFNLKSFSSDFKSDILLTEGKVNIFSESDAGRRKITQLVPNQLVSLNMSDLKFTKKTVNPKKYIAWREGKLIFKDDDLSEMLLKLDRWYNVEFVLGSDLVTNYAFTGSFAGYDLSRILECIELTTPVRFELQPSSQDSTHYYTKTKINVIIKE